jgi:hypothetical protein
MILINGASCRTWILPATPLCAERVTLPMKASTIDNWTWPLIYGGILLLLLGISTLSADASLGWTMGVIGSASAAVGVFTIYLRSRIED